MRRYDEIDILKGVAVICMMVFHFYYFPNQYGFKEIKYDTVTLKTIAKVAQIIFITCVGINLVFAKHKNSDPKVHLQRVIKLSLYAMLMSLFTYHVFGDKYVKFGILHFVAFSSLVLFHFVDDFNKMKIITATIFIIYILNTMFPELFRIIPQPFAFIGGFYNDRYSAVDHFPIIPWILLICLGTFIGHNLLQNEYKSYDVFVKNPLSDILKNIGKKSLEIYAVHWIILYIVYCIIYEKIRKN